MRLLIIGGTRFSGRFLTQAALARGHQVALLHRRSVMEDPFPEAEHLHADRDGGLDVLAGRRWDTVVDMCGYVPRVVRQATDRLAANADRYVFVSSCSAYADSSRPGVDESGRLLELPEDERDSEEVMRLYGELKVACERVVESAFPGRAVIVRPGLIVGPFDPTNRFTYWVRRVHDAGDAGEMLAPGRPDRRVQFIDARDLAHWMLTMAEGGEPGAYNAVGPRPAPTMAEVLDACAVAAGIRPTSTWVPDECLVEAGVGPWMELPLWIPESDPEAPGFFAFDASRAMAAGLGFRSLEETCRDTLAWDLAANPRRRSVADGEQIAGLAAAREAEVLAAWRTGGR